MKSTSKTGPKPRTRTFSGCLTCRSRKVKCDLQKPICGNCKRLKKECRGYQSTLHWVAQPSTSRSRPDSTSQVETEDDSYGRMRTQVSTVDSQKAMSARLREAAFPEGSQKFLEQVLESLEVQALQSGSGAQSSRGFTKGPFGVFTPKTTTNGSDDPMSDQDVSILDQLNDAGNDFTSWENFDDLAETSLELDFYDSSINPSVMSSEQFVSLDSPKHGAVIIEEDTVFDPGTFFFNESQLSNRLYNRASIVSLSPQPSIPETSSPYLPRCGRFLLWHYANSTIPTLTDIPQNNSKAVQSVIHFPSALKAWAELDIMGDSNLAKVSLLYSLLAIAAFQLSALHQDIVDTSSPVDGNGTPNSPPTGLSSSTHWQLQGQNFRRISQTAFRRCLQNIANNPGVKYKYNDVFLAAISNVTVGLVSGDTNNCRFYLLHCEQILRNVKPDNPLSKKTQTLHRIFLFLQTIEAASFSQSQEHYKQTLLTHSTDTTDELSLVKFMPDANSEIEISQALTRVSLEELRLIETDEDSHEAVYGMPGSLLRLIIRTTGLIEEIEASPFGDTTPNSLPPELNQKAMLLEHSICSWGSGTDISKSRDYLPSIESADIGSYVSEIRPEMLARTMSKALSTSVHHALLIHFFRSVRNTNPGILQHYVESVIWNLELHEQCKKSFAPSRVNVIVWPSFIAACEAIGEDLRLRSIGCIRHALWSGFRNHVVAERVTREVWKRRDMGYWNTTWRSVVRGMNISMALT